MLAWKQENVFMKVKIKFQYFLFIFKHTFKAEKAMRGVKKKFLHSQTKIGVLSPIFHLQS